jgi:hypothetical protein
MITDIRTTASFAGITRNGSQLSPTPSLAMSAGFANGCGRC